MIKICGIEKESIVDGSGLRYVVFAQGCPHRCIGCHNPESHSFSSGKNKYINEIIDDIKHNPLLKGVTFSGGEPFEQARSFIKLSNKIKALNKEMGFNLDIWCFTGYRIEEILNSNDESKLELLKYIDILVDGKFELNLKTIEKPFVGSSNQRVIDVKNSKFDDLVLWNDKKTLAFN